MFAATVGIGDKVLHVPEVATELLPTLIVPGTDVLPSVITESVAFVPVGITLPIAHDAKLLLSVVIEYLHNLILPIGLSPGEVALI